MDWWWVWSAVATANRAAKMKACKENFLISSFVIFLVNPSSHHFLTFQNDPHHYHWFMVITFIFLLLSFLDQLVT